jgi:hypothetical protein
MKTTIQETNGINEMLKSRMKRDRETVWTTDFITINDRSTPCVSAELNTIYTGKCKSGTIKGSTNFQDYHWYSGAGMIWPTELNEVVTTTRQAIASNQVYDTHTIHINSPSYSQVREEQKQKAIEARLKQQKKKPKY